MRDYSYLTVYLNLIVQSDYDSLFQPISPMKPPMKPPTNAPSNGMGMTAWPIVAPIKPDPIELAVSNVMNPMSYIFFFLLANLLLKMQQKVYVQPPVANSNPNRGTLVATKLNEPDITVRFERSSAKAPNDSQFFMEARHFPSEPPTVLTWSVRVSCFNSVGLCLSFWARAFLFCTRSVTQQFCRAASETCQCIRIELQFITSTSSSPIVNTYLDSSPSSPSPPPICTMMPLLPSSLTAYLHFTAQLVACILSITFIKGGGGLEEDQIDQIPLLPNIDIERIQCFSRIQLANRDEQLYQMFLNIPACNYPTISDSHAVESYNNTLYSTQKFKIMDCLRISQTDWVRLRMIALPCSQERQI